jgi:DNA modification methylase
MRHLVRLVTHPGSLVCDPFTGSGTTGVAVMLEGEGRSFVGIDHDPDHVNDARRRVHHVTGGVKPARETTEKPAPEPPQQTSLFDLLG